MPPLEVVKAPMNTFANAHALVVGIDDYAGPGIASLPPTVRQDAEDVEALLRDPARCGYAGGSVHPLLGPAATRDAVRTALDELTAATDPDSTAVPSFSRR